MTFRKQIENELKRHLQLPADYLVEITAPDHESQGHYSTNLCLKLAKERGVKPVDLGTEFIKKLPADSFFTAEVAGPGFLNFRIKDGAIVKFLQEEILDNPDWGRTDIGGGKLVRLEYFQPNVAKTLHVGHLRSAIIGDALKRMFVATGHRVYSDNHLGDWGTQFGILLYGFKELNKEAKEKIESGGLEALTELYVAESAKIEAEPTRRDLAKEEFAKLERGDEENKKIWEWMVRISVDRFQKISEQLELLPFEEQLSESFFEPQLKSLVDLALEKKIATIQEDKSVIVDLAEKNLDQAVLLKADGASTYLLRDLATILFFKKGRGFESNLYVVDDRQTHHFRQVFEVAERLGFSKLGENEHVKFGFMSLPEGALSTRRGAVAKAEDLIQEVTDSARKVIEEKNPDLTDKEGASREVALAALKFFDLRHHRESNIVFRKEEALSFEGATGPYLQYAYARLKSILKKVEVKENKNFENIEISLAEKKLAMLAARLPEELERGIVERAPSVIAGYLLNLAQATNEFYHTSPVIKETDMEKQAWRLSLVAAAAISLKEGLELLGIKPREEM
jgi:arginyl-tRNA synthetase